MSQEASLIAHFVLFVLCGHISGALLLYFAHRFVFHGKLGNLPVFRQFRKLHIKHHQHAFHVDLKNIHLQVPWWAKLSVLFVIAIIAFQINLAFALGIATFYMLYEHRHYAIHNYDNTSHFHKHHAFHHRKPRVNYSGVYPFIDKIFGTYENTHER